MKRILMAALITVSLGAVVFGQRGPRGEAPAGQRGPGQRGDQATALKNALGLTDGQVDAIKTLTETRNDRAKAIMTEIDQKRQALNTLLSAASPSAQDVGNAAISLRASENKLSAERDWFISEIKKLLTGDQQQKLDTLMAANGGREIPGLGFGGPGLRRGGPGGGR